MRISSAALLALGLSACAPEAGAPQGETIACAIGPGAEFADECVLERRALEEGREMLVIHHPGGGFRRFVMERSTLLPLDGAEPLVMVALDAASGIEFTVAGDRYRLPPAGEPE
ncbi:hypothetical protein [Erythrobacter sp.]|uniref:hypothetical protein n=1 Tax=Erythrobacter sp. TaxID=1042 RepID=UPI001425F56F|nr:hypothetical protein [Erythrobacter sp.]QIQ85947.1 MAG: hypothetical protein G9473_04055 [Erythrobacter sp.]